MSKIPLMLVGIKEEEKLSSELTLEQSSEFKYDAISQTGNTIAMAETHPTTRSTITSTTFGSDGDEGNDDEGTD